MDVKIKLLPLCTLLVFASLCTTAHAQAAIPPAPNQFVASTAVKALTGTRAVVYRSHGLKLGIEDAKTARPYYFGRGRFPESQPVCYRLARPVWSTESSAFPLLAKLSYSHISCRQDKCHPPWPGTRLAK